MTRPELTVVILNYNHADDVIACVRSIERENCAGVSVLVVDNASTNDSVAELERALDGHRLVESGRNGGFAEGTNVGIRAALEAGADWVLLLNPDTAVEPGFFDAFFDFAASHPDARAAGGVGYYESDPDKIWFGGGYFDWFRGRGECFLQGEPRAKLPDPDVPRRCQFLTCACLFVHREAVEGIGLLDESYFLGGEEWDYSRRLSRAGYDLFLLGRVGYLHKVTGTHVKYSPKYVYNGYRTKLMFMQKERPLIYPVWSRLFKLVAAARAAKHFTGLEPELVGREAEVKQAVHRAFEDHVKYRSLELAHLDQFSD